MTFRTQTKRALVVDDMAFNRRLIGAVLMQDGWLIEQAEDAFAALAALERAKFDLVLLDVALGKAQSGYQVLEAIRKRRDLDPLPVILVTGTACTPEEVAKGLLAGAQDHVTKPFEPIVLRARVMAAMRGHAALRAVEARAAHISDNAKAVQTELDEATRVQRAGMPRVPLVQSGLCVSGESIAARKVSGDTFDFVVDDKGGVSIVLLDVAGHGPASGLVLSASREALRRALIQGAPLDQVIEALQSCLKDQGGVLEAAVAVGILRFSPSEPIIELLNAGLPPILTATAGGGLVCHPSRSAPIGLLRGGRHPSERITSAVGDTWMLVSDGLTGGVMDEDAILGFATRIGFGHHGAQLAAADPTDLRSLMLEYTSAFEIEQTDDMTLVIAAREDGGQGRIS